MLNFCLLTPKRYILALNRVVWRITRENRFRGLGCRLLEEPRKKTAKSNRKSLQISQQCSASSFPLKYKDTPKHHRQLICGGMLFKFGQVISCGVSQVSVFSHDLQNDKGPVKKATYNSKHCTETFSQDDSSGITAVQDTWVTTL